MKQDDTRVTEKRSSKRKDNRRYTFDSVEQLDWVAKRLTVSDIDEMSFEELKLMIDELKDMYDKEHGGGGEL